MIHPLKFFGSHYKKKYHLKFRHAKKLFLFDLVLLLTILITAGAGIFWFLYDPTVSNLVFVSIQPDKDKFQSGEHISFNINYENKSDVNLIDSYLQITLPPGFVLDKSTPEIDSEKNQFSLGLIKPNDKNEIILSGWFFGTPDQGESVRAILNYKQEDRQVWEQSLNHILITPRDSVINFRFETDSRGIFRSRIPIKFYIKNEGELTAENIAIPVEPLPGVRLIAPDFLTIEDKLIIIGKLEPNQEISFDMEIDLDLSDQTDKIELNILPLLFLNQKQFAQKSHTQTIEIINPRAEISTEWQGNTNLSPGEITILNLKIINNGNSELSNLEIKIPIPTAIVDTTKLINLNNGRFSGTDFIFFKQAQLLPNQSLETTLQVPIKYNPTGGTNLILTLSPSLSASIPAMTNNYIKTVTTPEIKIGTQLNLDASIIYYNTEGDQLGRGPLPAQVGEQTKYWAIIKITNTSSEVKNCQFSAKLPSYVTWTGKTSVSKGLDIKNNNNNLSWSIDSLLPHETVGLYFELAFTPIASQVNTTPLMLTNIKVSGHDNYINKNIERAFENLDISLPKDELGRSKGTLITKI